MATVNKKQLVDRLAERLGEKSVVVKSIIQHLLDDIILRTQRRQSPGISGFWSVQRKAGGCPNWPEPKDHGKSSGATQAALSEKTTVARGLRKQALPSP